MSTRLVRLHSRLERLWLYRVMCCAPLGVALNEKELDRAPCVTQITDDYTRLQPLEDNANDSDLPLLSWRIRFWPDDGLVTLA
jgi:hypothetical protein